MLQAQLDQKSTYIDQLIEAIALARQQFFGSRNQKIDTQSNQLSWLFNEAETITDHESNDADHDDDEPGGGKKQTAPRKRRRRSNSSRPCIELKMRPMLGTSRCGSAMLSDKLDQNRCLIKYEHG